MAVSAARRTGVLVINLNKIKTPALQKGMEFYLMGESPRPFPRGWMEGSFFATLGRASSQHWAVFLFSTAGCGLRAGGDQLYGAARSAMESATKKK